RRPHPPRARGARDATGPLQDEVPRADPAQHAPRRGAEPQEDDLRVRADLPRRSRLQPRGRLGAGDVRRHRRHAPRRTPGGRMKEDKLMAHDPLSDADAILSEEYYGRRRDGAPAAEPRRPRAAGKPPKPTHYKVICISMYT